MRPHNLHTAIPRSSLRLPDAGATRAPEADGSICKLCDVTDWGSLSFKKLAREVTQWPPEADFRHRKVWEFVQTVRALKAYHLLDERAIGVSVAAGREALLFYLANHVGRIVATDLYGDTIFASREADRGFLTDPQRFAPFAYRADRLQVLHMNAVDLRFDDDMFDFAYSLSSIEHFGGVEAALASLREMIRVVKPGGLVIVATECALNDVAAQDVFRIADIERLVSGCGADLIQPIDYHLSDATLECLTDFYRDDLNALPHINLRKDDSIFTSLVIAFRKSPVSMQSTRSDRLLETDATLLDEDIDDIRELYGVSLAGPRSIGRIAISLENSAFTRIPLLGRVWRWLRRPFHQLVCYYLNRHIEELNQLRQSQDAALVDELIALRRRLRRLESLQRRE